MPLQNTEFSTSKMKSAVKSETSKRVSKSAADSLGESLEEHISQAVSQSLEITREDDRKTLRAEDVTESRSEKVGLYQFDLPNAPVERIARNAGAERVSKEAVEELNREAVAYLKELAKRMDALADHANRSTVKEDDLEMALTQVNA